MLITRARNIEGPLFTFCSNTVFRRSLGETMKSLHCSEIYCSWNFFHPHAAVFAVHHITIHRKVEASWNVMEHAQKPDFVFRRNGRVHLNQRGASVQSTTGSRGVRISGSNVGYTMFLGSVKGTGTHSIRQFPRHFPSRASSAIIFQLDSTLQFSTASSSKTTLSPCSRRPHCWNLDPSNWALVLRKSRLFNSARVIKGGCVLP